MFSKQHKSFYKNNFYIIHFDKANNNGEDKTGVGFPSTASNRESHRRALEVFNFLDINCILIVVTKEKDL